MFISFFLSLLLLAKILGVIQARMGSNRLPGKVMMQILGKPMIWHIYNRLKTCNVDEICIATSTNPNDDKIEEFALKEDIKIFRGSENLILDRLLSATKKFKADAIARITADCPLVDPDIVNHLIQIYRQSPDLDFICNKIGRAHV